MCIRDRSKGGAGDRGGQNAVRYVRLPFGVNSKRSAINLHGAPFPVTLHQWHPERRYTLTQIIEGLKLDVAAAGPKPGAKSKPGDKPRNDEPPTLRALRGAGRILREETSRPGTWHIVCPWSPEHTNADVTGTYYYEPNTNRNANEAFKCNHGHCAARTIRDLRDVLAPAGAFEDLTPLIRLDAPFEAARSIVAAKYQRGVDRTIVYWQSEFHVWEGSHYRLRPTPDVREMLYCTTAETADKQPKKRNIDELVDALKAASNLSDLTRPPAYLRDQTGDRCPRTFIPMKNGILIPETDELLPATPRLFATYALPFDFEPLAPPPHEWIKFLADLWGDDQESIHLLQEWMGYLLTPRTEQQKALMLIGPKRGGKGTIARIIQALLGEHNYCSPRLADLGTHFGLQGMIGKLLAVVSDARLGGNADVFALAENLLRITGEDAVSIPRKFMIDYTARLPTRIMVLTNELPRFTDGSGALPSRFLILRLTRTFFGAEDHGLESRLMTELPSILNWALTGLDRLTQRGRFVQPSAAAEMIEELELLASPVRAFLADECVIEPGATIAASHLFDAFTEWCRVNGRDHTGTAQTFGRDLRSALPNLKSTQPRQAGNRGRHYAGVRIRRLSDG